MNKTVKISKADAVAETQNFIVKVYGWMSLALMITGLVAIWTASNVDIAGLMAESRWIFFGLIILELVLVAYLVGWIAKMSSQTAALIFVLYSMVNGFTLSIIFLIYTADSIASTFFIHR